MTDVTTLVSRFGGEKAVAERFGLTVKAVEQWVARGGIPGRWHIALLLWAEEAGVPLSMSDLSEEAAAVPAEARA